MGPQYNHLGCWGTADIAICAANVPMVRQRSSFTDIIAWPQDQPKILLKRGWVLREIECKIAQRKGWRKGGGELRDTRVGETRCCPNIGEAEGGTRRGRAQEPARFALALFPISTPWLPV